MSERPWQHSVTRLEDMSADGKLTLTRQRDGDVVVTILAEGRGAQVEFCASGGRSPKTLRALHALFAAMQEDDDDPAAGRWKVTRHAFVL